MLPKVIRFYLDCLETENSGLSTPARKHDVLGYTELRALPDQRGNFSKAEQKLFEQFKFEQFKSGHGSGELFFGYPTIIKKVKNKNNDHEGWHVMPVFLYPIEEVSGMPKINQKFPTLNFPTVNKKLADRKLEVEKALGLDSEDNPPDVTVLVDKLYRLVPNRCKEPILPNNLSVTPALSGIQNDGIYNKAVFITGRIYTRGLESELKSLLAKSGEYQHTALAQLINDFPAKKIKSDVPLLEVSPLNTEQLQSIQHALENALTVIHGPPGTGKSQVVANLLINAAFQGKTVLFASKNNKAVEVVEQRVNGLTSIRAILIRLGWQYDAELPGYLTDLLGAISSEDDAIELKNHQEEKNRLGGLFASLKKQEEQFVALRNKTDLLDRQADAIRKSNPSGIYDELKGIDPKKFQEALDVFHSALNAADKNNHGFWTKLFWFTTKHTYYDKLISEAKAVGTAAPGLELPAPVDIDENDLSPWADFHQQMTACLDSINTINAFTGAFESLKNTTQLEVITEQKIALAKEITKNDLGLWEKWLKRQPATLSSKDRKKLVDYLALWESANKGRTENKKISAALRKLQKEIARFLPAALAITSLSVKGRIPFIPGCFDIVVFDEASQCDIASAIPLLYRAKQAVVIGDPKQLKHITQISQEREDQLLTKHDLLSNPRWKYSTTSLFNLVVGSADKNIALKNHYRSHSDIIGFSNEEFYDENLRINTDYGDLRTPPSEQDGVRWIDVAGAVARPPAGSAVNETEANAVVAEIKKLIFENHYEGTLGVVTPFREQANLIHRIVGKDSVLYKRLLKQHNFLVQTAHQFQGDERDVMIFSPVLSENMPEGSIWFMKQEGYIFNVAITRARAMLLVVGDRDAVLKCEVDYLKRFAQYIRNIEKLRAKPHPALPSLDGTYPTVHNPEQVSPWEKVLYKALCDAGIKSIPQYSVDQYTLDFAVFDGGRKLNIEVDGERYHKDWTGELCRRDEIRNQRLFGLGWEVKRFWVYEIRDDIPRCVEQIQHWLKNQSNLTGM